MIDTKKRGLVKAISWRIISSTVLGLLTWLITGSIQAVGLMLILFNIIQICVYFFHERVWSKILWGRTRGLFIQMTGMSGAGKTTISEAVAKKLKQNGYNVEIIDGDEYRTSLCSDLGFSKEDRNTNIRRLGFVGKVLARNNVIAIMAAINPYDVIRQELSEMGNFVKTAYIKCDIETLKQRDPKGLYKRALLKEGHPDKINNFTGISDPFEEPNNPDLIIDTEHQTLDQSVESIYNFIVNNVS